MPPNAGSGRKTARHICRSVSPAAARNQASCQRVTPTEQWFRDLDYDVFYEEADGWTWAHLRRRSNPSAVVPRYGRGHTPDEAAVSAKRRWEVEQIG